MEAMSKGSHPLYPVVLEVEYKIPCRGMEVAGEGRTMWIGSKGLVFIASGQIPACDRIEVSLLWPAELEGARLKLVVTGRVSARDGDKITVAITKYEFHTRAAHPGALVETLPLFIHAHAS